MRRVAALAAAAVTALVVAGCGGPTAPSGTDPAHRTTSPHPTSSVPTTAPQPSGGLLVLPPSSHVTGTYPAHCAARNDAAGHPLPDPACTPGAVRSDVTEANIASNVCKTGWTATVRPPLAETGALKTRALTAYGDPASARSATELDHFVPLELAGSSDVTNLWPEPADWPNHPPYELNHKDQVENDLKAAVCSHRVQLVDAQRAIAADWGTAEHSLGIGP